MFCIKDAEELIATKIETNEEIYLEKHHKWFGLIFAFLLSCLVLRALS